MSRLPGLSDDQVTDLIVSVGTHQKNRHLTPAGVARAFQTSIDAGTNLLEICKVVSINDSMVRRFLMLATLPASVRDLVRWGRPKAGISMTVASHIARLPTSVDQKSVAAAAVEFGLTGPEVIQITQTKRRSNRPIEECIDAALKLRPEIDRQNLFIGLVRDANTRDRIRSLKSDDRRAVADRLMASITTGLEGSLQLGESSFSILAVGELAQVINELQPDFEHVVNNLLEKHLA